MRFYDCMRSERYKRRHRNRASATQRVEEFLRAHDEFLDEFVDKFCDEQRVVKWLEKKKHYMETLTAQSHGKQRRAKSAADVHAELDIAEKFTLFPLTRTMLHKPTLLYELAKWMFFTINADSFQVYVASLDEKFLSFTALKDPSRPKISKSTCFKVEPGEYAAQYAAWKRTAVSISVARNGVASKPEPKFPKGVFNMKPEYGHALSYPITTSDNHLIGVVELFRKINRMSFSVESLQDRKERLNGLELSDFLLQVTRCIFQDMGDLDLIVMKILKYAKELVTADRASMFLVDFDRNELYAKVFDLGNITCSTTVDADVKKCMKEQTPASEIEEIRFPIDKGFAGYVATTGETLNVEDAYTDERFNGEIDRKTGYRTKSVLCMPIFNGDQVIGVVQMVNKHTGSFTKVDESAFGVFATYCGLALGHAKLYEKVNMSEKKLKVALEILTYHASCSASELEAFHSVETIPELAYFEFDSWDIEDDNKPSLVEAMFRDMFPYHEIDDDTLRRFILTVRKNYREIPYHNWTHAFSVTNSIYSMLKSLTSYKVKKDEALSLFIAALCHDLDHMGKTNSYMVQSGTCLGELYTMSTMENHHFNRAVAILQQDPCNVLRNLNSQQYRSVLSKIKHCILSTDLELHFKHFTEICEARKNDHFIFDDEENRKLMLSLMMTSADLCANYKPFDQQRSICLKVMEEFWLQGDEERRNNLQVMPMNDRNLKHTLPEQQLRFLNYICVPCFKTLGSILPELKPMYLGILNNIEEWTRLNVEGFTI